MSMSHGGACVRAATRSPREFHHKVVPTQGYFPHPECTRRKFACRCTEEDGPGSSERHSQGAAQGQLFSAHIDLS